MQSIFDPYSFCPCGSNKKAKFCCLNGKNWDKKPTLLKPKIPITKYSHERCYANQTNNCTSKISKEHFISNNILANLEFEKTVKITGLPWQEKQKFNLLSRSSLVANILCTSHNELLSPFDSEAGRLSRTFLRFDEDFNTENPAEDLAVFSGEDLEKWMLKTACAFIASNQISTDAGKMTCKLKDIYVDILFNDAPWPENWGLYFKIPEDNVIQKFQTISFMPFAVNNELKAAEFLINNFRFYLLLGQPDENHVFGIHRLRGIQFKKDGVTKTIEICWQDKKYNEGAFLERVGTTKEPPKEWDEYLKK